MKLPAIGYALLCITAPMVWGLLVVWISNRIERKLRGDKRPECAQDVPPIDYHI